jgi:hypothetical protein
MTGRWRRSALTPWAGLFLGALAWAVHHQAGSDAVYWDCRLGGPLLTGGLGLVCGLVAAGGGLASWMSRQAPPSAHGRPETRGFAAMVSVMGAGVFLLAIVTQALAGFIIPGCQR